jgi:cytoskeleton protein RodZ
MSKVTHMSLDEEGAGRRRIHLREISGDSETPLETVGQELRAARLRRGDDLATVSRALKIRKDHLSAVEDDNLEGLPGKTYALGFVRSYATYLGLDSVQMVERFKQETSGRHDELSSASVVPDEEGRKLPYGRIGAGVVLLALGYGTWHLLATGPAPQPVPPPPALAVPRPAPKPVPPPPVAQTQAIPSPALTQAPTAAQAPAAATPSAAQNGPSGPASANAASVTPAQQKAAASPANGGSAMPSPAVPMARPASAQDKVPAAAGQVFGAQNKNARVVLHASADTHIIVRGQDGMVYINRTLKAGETYRVPNVPGLSLTSTNAGAVQFELDGQMMGRAGADQETAGDINLNPQAIADRGNSR